MGFIELYFRGKKAITPQDLESFKSQKIEESINLDYKDIRAYGNPDKLSQHVSSFANCEGGLIFLGMSQDEIKKNGKIVKIYPKEVTWGEATLEKESLESRILSGIRPPLSRLVIIPVRNEKNQVIFLIDIPRSELAPHMAPDRRYHTRINFGTRTLEHHEVSNLFRINWTMKEKLVEKIYEPLSAILEKHAKEAKGYSYPMSVPIDVDEILSRTYYRFQMPPKLLKRIDHYVSQLKALRKKHVLSQKATLELVNRITAQLLKPIRFPSRNGASSEFAEYPILDSGLGFEFKVHSEKSNFALHPIDIYKTIMKNKEILAYLKEGYSSHHYHQVTIEPMVRGVNHGLSLLTLDTEKFNKDIWKTYLKKASRNTQIIEMRKKTEAFVQEALDLIDEITKY